MLELILRIILCFLFAFSVYRVTGNPDTFSAALLLGYLITLPRL